jgi:hypothetical protein
MSDYFYDLTPDPVSIPDNNRGFFQGLAGSAGPRLDAYRATKADESRWQDMLNAFPENAGGLTRAQMFQLGRDPATRPYAIELLTGRAKPVQFQNAAPHAAPPLPLPRPRPQPPAFGPSRMATDADYQTMPGWTGYSDPYAGLGGWR